MAMDARTALLQVAEMLGITQTPNEQTPIDTPALDDSDILHAIRERVSGLTAELADLEDETTTPPGYDPAPFNLSPEQERQLNGLTDMVWTLMGEAIPGEAILGEVEVAVSAYTG